MEEYQKKYYELFQFLGGYFHQDWHYDYDSKDAKPEIEDVVRHYKSEAGKDTIGKVTQEIESLLSENLSEAELRKILIKLGNSHYAPATHETYKKWLESILQILRTPNNAKALKRIA